MIDFTEVEDGETWELFARDYLEELGFYIETDPDRGADHGKDILITEQLSGKIGEYKFRWLVSCKHYAVSERSVTENDEKNILERVKDFNADGFIGFYSTIASSNLSSRLHKLHQNKEIKDFKIIDYKTIENKIIRTGFSKLIMRYFPESYKVIKPLHLIFEDYYPLKCNNCGKDLLYDLYSEKYRGIIVFVKEHIMDENDHIKNSKIVDIYWACKNSCDHKMKYKHNNYSTGSWEDIGDLVIPTYFLRWLFGIINNLQSEENWITDDALEKLKYFIGALSQKVFREMTEKEMKRTKSLLEFML